MDGEGWRSEVGGVLGEGEGEIGGGEGRGYLMACDYLLEGVGRKGGFCWCRFSYGLVL